MVNISNSSFPSLKVFKALAQLADLPFVWKRTNPWICPSYPLKMYLQYYSLQRIMSQCYFHESNATSSSFNKDFPRNVRSLFYFQSIKYNRIIQCSKLFPQNKALYSSPELWQSNGTNHWIQYRIKVVKCKYYATYSTVWWELNPWKT